jgi:hypothetical protein
LPDEPDFELISDARFKFSLDALLLAWSYPRDVSILTSSCVCGIRESIGAIVQEKVDADAAVEADCGGCGKTGNSKPPGPDPESPIEFARSHAWQTIFDALITRNLHTQPDVQSPEVLEADLAEWKRHAMLLIVPTASLTSAIK